MDMDMVCPWKDPWGLSHSLRPWEAWAALTDLCGCSQPPELPRSSSDVYVGRLCHCHCGGDRRSRHVVRLVWVNRFFGCRTSAVGTLDLIHHTIYRSYLSTFDDFHPFLGNFFRLCGTLESSGDSDPSMCLRREFPPSWPVYPLPCLGVIEPLHGLL